MSRRFIKNGEVLAISREAIKSGSVDGRKCLWWANNPGVLCNERVGAVSNVQVVHIVGSLEHRRLGADGDSYEGIVQRVIAAFDGGEAGPPDAVVLRIDSPGGVVSGLNEAVKSLVDIRKRAGIPMYAYVDELAASAAYAIACACDEIILPRSAICGSVGVISMMMDQVEADKMAGLNVVTITSGARKADGHPHVAVTDAAVAAEQGRVDALADQFFGIVSLSRGLSKPDIAALEAGIFLGTEAVNVCLADSVMSWSEFVEGVSQEDILALEVRSRTLHQTEYEKDPVPASIPDGAKGEMKMLVKLNALVSALTKKMESAPSGKRAAIKADLEGAKAAVEAYKKIKKTVEKYEQEEADDEEDEEESSTASAKGNETDRKESDMPPEKKDEGDEDDEDSAAAASTVETSLMALAEQVTGKSGRSAVGALSALVSQGQRASERLDAIEKERAAEKKDAMIDAALNARKITRHEAKTLRAKSIRFVGDFLDMRPKAIVNVDDDSVRFPNPNDSVSGTLSGDVMSAIDSAIAHAPDGADKVKLRAEMIAAQEQRLSRAGNGVGRY